MGSDRPMLQVLIVVGDVALRQSLETIITRQAYPLSSYTSVEACLSATLPTDPFVLLVENNLPGLSGLDLVRAWQKQNMAFESILISQKGSVDMALEALRLGVSMLLPKTISEPALVRAIEMAQETLTLRLTASSTEIERAHTREVAQNMFLLRQEEKMRAQTERFYTLGMIVASVGHELNNPLTFVINNFAALSASVPTVKSLLQLARQTGLYKPSADAQTSAAFQTLEEFDQIIKETQNGLLMLREIADDLRSLSNRKSSMVSTFDLREAVKTGLRLVGMHLRQTAQLIVELPEEPIWLLGYRTHIVQAVINLLSNAAQAIDPLQTRSKEIRVLLGKTEKKAILEISDSGQGIEESYLDRIFEPFFTTKENGTGLGLSLVKNFVEEQHGSLMIESEVGRGTKVVIRFPLMAAPAAGAK